MALSYDQLLKTAKKCSTDDIISIETSKLSSGPSVILKYPAGQQLVEQQCESFPVQDFPQTPRVKGEPIPVNENLRQVFQEALKCASDDPLREVINGIFVDVSSPGCHQVVGTDGSHLYASNSFSLPLKNSLLIPKHKFLEWKGFNSDGEWKLKVGSDGSDVRNRFLQLSTRRWRFITGLRNGTFPNWKHVIPEDFRTTVHLDGDSLRSTMALINRIPSDDHPIFLIVGQGKLLINGQKEDEKDSVHAAIPGVRIIGLPVSVAVNRSHVLKALKYGLKEIEIQDDRSPLRFSYGGKQMIVVPARSTEPSPSASTETIQSEQRAPIQTEDAEREEVKEETPPNGLDAAMEEMELLRDALKANLTSVTAILNRIKLARREQKVRNREFRSIKSTLKSLQSVRI